MRDQVVMVDGAAFPLAGPTYVEPTYFRVKTHLLDEIESLPLGGPVPSERTLAASLGTSRTTVRRALLELATEGRIVRRQGARTYVTEPTITWSAQRQHLGGAGDVGAFDCAAGGASGGAAGAAADGASGVGESRLAIEEGFADGAVAGSLQIEPGAPIYRVARLRTIAGQTVGIEVAYLSAARFPQLPRHARRSTVAAALRDVFDVTPSRADVFVTLETAPPHEAELLGVVSGAVLLVVNLHSFDESGQPVEWLNARYRGDRVILAAALLARDA